MPTICPFCKEEFKYIGNHYPFCRVKEHYKIINIGDSNCNHELTISFIKTFKQTQTVDIILSMICENCELYIQFDTFERIWIPIMETYKKLENIKK